MSSRSKEWLAAYRDVDPEDMLQKQMMDLLAMPIHKSNEAAFLKRAKDLKDLLTDADLEDALRLNMRLNMETDPLNLLMGYELSTTTCNRLREIIKKIVDIGDRHTGPAQRGLVVTKPTPSKTPTPGKTTRLPATRPLAAVKPKPKTKPDFKVVAPKLPPIGPVGHTVVMPPLTDKDDPLSWLLDPLSVSLSSGTLIAAVAFQLGFTETVAVAALERWIFEEALQSAYNALVKSKHWPPNMQVGDSGERVSYFALKETFYKYLQRTGASLIDLNNLQKNFPAFDLFVSGQDFYSVKTYGVLSKTTDLGGYVKRKLKEDFIRLFDTDIVDKAARAMLSSGSQPGLGTDVATIKDYMLDNFKFCVPEDQKGFAISAFEEAMNKNPRLFPDAVRLSGESDADFTSRMHSLAGKYVRTFPIKTSTLRDLYKIVDNIDDIKKVLEYYDGDRFSWFKWFKNL